MAEPSRFGRSGEVPAQCPGCGKPWPSTLTRCPDCGSELHEETQQQSLHSLDTAFLPAARERWDERQTADDSTRIDASAVEDDTGLHVREAAVPVTPNSFNAVSDGSHAPSSRELTVQAPRLINSPLPPTAQPASDPTTAVKLDTGFVHLVAGTVVGEYEVERLLGSGGMGAVYGVRHERLGRRAALKVIAPSLSRDRDAVERFEQEAQALARISHPNIVNVLSVGSLPGDGRNYYLMEWLDGESLHDRLERARAPFDDALDILDQVARGLDAAHAAGIVHRDLKPDNCWLQQVGDESRRIVKILDLGLAKYAEHRRSEETAVNIMFGTPNYMSPEQCRSARDVGPATDVYALGCIAYELLCERLPFTYDNAAELVAAHGSEVPPAPRSLNPTLPPEIDALLTGMLAKDPMHRPTLAQVRRTITTALAALANPPEPTMAAAQSIPASIAPIAEPHAGRRVFVALAGVVVLGAIIVASVVGNSGAKLDKSPRVVEQPNRAIEIDTGVPPTVPPLTATVPTAPTATTPDDADAPLATSPPRMDANTVTSDRTPTPIRPGSSIPSDGRAHESEPTVVVEPEPKAAAVGTATVDAGVEPGEGDGAIEIDLPIRPATTSPPRRTPLVPTAKKPPKRNVISDPFKKKEITK